MESPKSQSGTSKTNIKTDSSSSSSSSSSSDSDTEDYGAAEARKLQYALPGRVRKCNKDGKKSKSSVVIRRRLGCCKSRLRKQASSSSNSSPDPLSVRLRRLTSQVAAEVGQEQNAGNAGDEERIEIDGTDTDNDNDSDNSSDSESQSYLSLLFPHSDQENGGEVEVTNEEHPEQDPSIVNLNYSDSGSETEFDENEIVHYERRPSGNMANDQLEQAPIPVQVPLPALVIVNSNSTNTPEEQVQPQQSQKNGQVPKARNAIKEVASTSRTQRNDKGTKDKNNRNRRKKENPEKAYVLSSGYSISKAAFKRTVQGILRSRKDNFRFRLEAISALQVASEDYMASIFEDCYKCARSRGAVTVQPKDMNLVLDIRGSKWLVPERSRPVVINKQKAKKTKVNR